VKRLPGLPAGLLRAAAAALSPAGSRASLLVLTFHRVLADHDPLLPDEPDAARFAALLDVLGDQFRIVDLADAVARLRHRTLPARCAAITFDDGYLNNCEVAAPILGARGMTATFFVTTGFLDGNTMWNDIVIESVRAAGPALDLRELGHGVLELPDWPARRLAVDQLLGKLKYLDADERLRQSRRIAAVAGWTPAAPLMMQSQDIRRLADKGMAIGAHTVTHPILCRLPDDVARREILDGKATLEALQGAPVRAFAYPNGRPNRDYGRRHVEMVRNAGFEVGVSTATGVCTRNCDPLQVPRVAPWGRNALRFGLGLLRAQTQRRPDLVP
jgi:peptidoglycan/xylan/chitin deacetylase (PgdA/CDA1 family)